jgi:2-oxoglutarate dehydrogenase E1 component
MNAISKGRAQSTEKELGNSSILTGSNAVYLDQLYEILQTEPAKLSLEWRYILERLGSQRPPEEGKEAELSLKRELAVIFLISAIRKSGFRAARVNPLADEPAQVPAELSPAFFGLSAQDLAQPFRLASPAMPPGSTIADAIALLQATYCLNVGAEVGHTGEAAWLEERLEKKHGVSGDGKRRILEMLTAAETLEQFLHKKYIGQKRFSLEGAETLIPLIDHLVEAAAAQGVRELVMGMAHRGRINVLVNIMGKPASELFAEFEGHGSEPEGATAGDVKYHKGYASDVATANGVVHLSLACNPSHLEIVNPVVEGSVRARQKRRGDAERNQVIPVLIHGDASFSGQGVVMETLSLSQARGFTTGGTVHVVINNQVGFTISNPSDSRSTLYSTDVAKMVGAPVFHVNADEPEAVLKVVEIALAYRMAFHKDVVVDLVCFRKLGHNEADEPMVTQPSMYRAVRRHPGTRKKYADKLVQEGIVSSQACDFLIAEYQRGLSQGQSMAGKLLRASQPSDSANWARFLAGRQSTHSVDTGCPVRDLQRLGEQLSSIPNGFKAHAVVEKVLAARLKMALGQAPVDWGMAENLAYATLLEEGVGIRLCGQDSGRGTFAHRHAVLHHQEAAGSLDSTYMPLSSIKNGQSFEVVDSLLSEEAVLAFEYGYSTAAPDDLVIWEAQFGDFANGAQVVIDQFISSGQAKWGRLSGLVMLLPHGYEGQGAEHSSARLERFLQLCAEGNMQVCNPSTPSQMFHLLRRQILQSTRKPLVVLTPKSLLRHKEAVSTLHEVAYGRFDTVLIDPHVKEVAQVERVILSTGKVYYDLSQSRIERNLSKVAVVRVEQLYPFPGQEIEAALALYSNAKEVVWVQEEPINQGAWSYMQPRLMALPVIPGLRAVGRPEAAAPAVGHMPEHNEQLQVLLEEALS